MAKAVAFGRFLCLGLVLILFHPLNSHAQMEETFPVLTIGTQSYTNVTVTTKARKYIFILHS
ncbi:MAG TPA: hypothetical protein VLT36_22590, partial [Candidatus Dormibacteraeota bacterium]|nr:hypothetical protein [Candidatus Dormibacteraeota bacterium]